MSFSNSSFSGLSGSPKPPDKKEDKAKGKYLKESFFILEHSTSVELEKGDETDMFSDKLLYFFPDHLSKDDQLYFVGVIQGYITFSSNFDPIDEKVTCIKFTNFKLAITFVGDVFICLSGPNSMPDDGLKRNLNRIIDCMVFFNGPLDLMKKRFSERHEYVEYMKQVGSEVALLTKIIQNPIPTPSSIFEPIPYLELPLNSNSLFMSANQILDSLFEYEGYQGGVILYDEQVLSSQLTDDIVQWILYRNTVIKETRKKNRKRSVLSEQSPLSSSLPNLNRSFLKEYSDDEGEMMTTMSIDDNVSDDELDVSLDDFYFDFNSVSKNFNKRIDIFPIYLTAKQAKHYPCTPLKEYEIGLEKLDKPTDGDIYFVIIVHADPIRIAVLLDFEQIRNFKILGVMKTDMTDKIVKLSSKIKTSLLSKQQSKYVIKSKVGFLRQSGYTSSVLIFDGINQQATGFYNPKSRFLNQVSVAHEHIQKNQEVKKIILRNNVGYLYCEKLYETEVYYHQPFLHKKNNFIEISPLESLEKTVRENILKDFEINLL
jgi:hypothetical protein